MIKRFKAQQSANGNDLGLGTNSAIGRRSLNKDGSFNVTRSGVPILRSFETYHRLISMSWTRFNLLVASLYFFVNIVFAVLYWAIGLEGLQGINSRLGWDGFWESFFFSAQTLTTVGYGRVSPVGNLANSIAAVESMIGLLGFALATGLLYGRFSRPEAKIKYSKNALIAPYKDGKALMFRIVNDRKNQLIEVEAAASLSMTLPNQPNSRQFFNLKLEVTKINFFPLSWTVVHAINEDSPLYGLTENEILEQSVEVICLIKAFDDTFSQVVYSRSSYTAPEIIWNAKFVPMTTFNANGAILHVDKINSHEKI